MATISRWRTLSAEVIRGVLEAAPPGATRAECQRLLTPAYPFGERSMHPYKVWLSECRRQLDARFGRRERTLYVALTACGPKCPFAHAKNMLPCLACVSHWERWDAIPLASRLEFAATVQAARGGDAVALAAARDWSEEHMGGLPLEGVRG